MTAPARLTIDIWSDIVCPWCIIGYRQLQKALSELEGEIEADIRWHPFELNPDLPPEGEDLAQHMMRKYGMEPSEAGSGQMREIARQAGYDMRYLGGDPEPEQRMWNTFNAHLLLLWVFETQGRDAQTRLKLALFDAHFQHRRNISDWETLFDIAESAGIAKDGAQAAMADEGLEARVREEERAAMEKGITSVPMMLVESRFMIPGAQEPETYVASLRKVVERMSNVD